MYTEVIHTNVFELILNDKYICGYIFPVCDERSYKELSAHDYIDDVLSDKPDIIKNDDFLDKLY